MPSRQIAAADNSFEYCHASLPSFLANQQRLRAEERRWHAAVSMVKERAQSAQRNEKMKDVMSEIQIKEERKHDREI